ncbi:MFS transporter [Streptococcus suis]|uniref:Lantibiotic efflux protein n=1 Tax=Streptococcus suis TaxID=1307 RepID=A0A0Z8K170_STRSU|nr:MFS transporter [Streptococcus suis]AGZ22863.1 Major Facilitator Superfamily protein [Streptococcus suis T15]MBO8084068.1 MFS transporter [Streptococcus suis]MBS8078247.1 MFS transporter [Streptococcus suis]MCB2884181.1 MFS transporter [Streptococcus suis]MCB2892278.1 MFS transporter [Streptococcus suis]
MKRLIHNKLFLSSFVADLISNFGDTLYYLALMNYVLLLPDTKFALAMITASETLPILAGLFIGIWADKTKNKLDTILATLVVRVGLYAFVGFLMGSAPALWVVAVVCVINFLSDLAGQYENGLYMPVSLRVVAAEDRETAMAFKMTVKSLLQIAFQASGAILIGFMSYQNLAFFNAGTFLVSLAIMVGLRPAFAKLLKENPIQEAEQAETEAGIIKGMRNSLKESYQAVQNIPVLKASIVTIASLNAIFTALSPLVILNMKEFSDFVIVNAGTTVALISIFFSVGSILGSSIGMALFKNVSLINLLKFSTLMPVLIFSGFFLHNIYVVLAVIFVTAVTLGIFNPKMSALVMNELPEDKLATVGGGIDTFCQIGMVVGQALVALMVTILSVTSISLIFLLLSVGLVSYTILVGRKPKNEEAQA